MTYQHTDQSGIHIATAEMPEMESVSAAIYLPVGSRYEPAPLNGIAHFAEHMIFKGTATRSALDIALQIEGAGGTMNAFTTEDQTCLETRGPAELMPVFIEIMADMLWNSSFREDELEREREVIAEEIIMYQENPSDHLHDLLSKALWNNHPLGRPITGTLQSIEHIDSEELKNFTRQYYHSTGVTLAVSGKVKHSEVCALAEKYLPKKTHQSPSFEHFNRPSASTRPYHLHDQRDIEQTHLAIGFHTEGRHSETRHVLRILSLLLGETMSSRLFQELREKRGLCYHITTDYSLYHDTGTFEIHAGLDADRLAESIAVIRTVLAQVLATGFTESELKQAIHFASCQARIELETPHSHMSWIGDSLMSFNKILDPAACRATLESTTLSELDNLVKKLLKPENLAIASIGPQSTDKISALCNSIV